MDARDLSQSVRAALAKKRPIFQGAVLEWAERHTRDYPWRRPRRTPYEVVVAEALLKRTTATAVARVYENFLKRFPSPQGLATASEGELIDALSEVGLQKQRARTLKALAQYLLLAEAGKVPNDLERLQRVPGLGPYSARAVLSFAYDIPAAVLDASVERVIQRVFQGTVRHGPSQSLLQVLADELLPDWGHRKYNFGLLDLAALVCRYVGPKCKECPLNTICDYSRRAPQRAIRPSELREKRREKKMSQSELAKKAGTSKLTIIKIEAGRVVPQLKTIQKLAEALKVAPELLTEQRKARL